jgi:hypothetical protein
MTADGFESCRDVAEKTLGKLEVHLGTVHRAVTHVGREQRELGVQIRSFRVPALESMHGEGMTNLMETRAAPSPVVGNAGGSQKLPKCRVQPSAGIHAATGRGEERLTGITDAKHFGVSTQPMSQARGYGNETVLPKLALADPEDSVVEVHVSHGQAKDLSLTKTTAVKDAEDFRDHQMIEG